MLSTKRYYAPDAVGPVLSASQQTGPCRTSAKSSLTLTGLSALSHQSALPYGRVPIRKRLRWATLVGGKNHHHNSC